MNNVVLYIDPKSDRIIYFAPAGEEVPAVVAIFMDEGVHEYRSSELNAHEFHGELPMNLQRQISCLFKYQDGALVFSPPE